MNVVCKYIIRWWAELAWLAWMDHRIASGLMLHSSFPGFSTLKSLRKCPIVVDELLTSQVTPSPNSKPLPNGKTAGQGHREEDLAWRLLLTSHVTPLFLSKTLANWQNCVCRSRAWGGRLGLEAASDLSCGFCPAPDNLGSGFHGQGVEVKVPILI